MVTPSGPRGGVAIDDSAPCESGYSSSDSFTDSDGGVSLWLSIGETCQTIRKTIPKINGSDGIAGSSRRVRPVRFTSRHYSKQKRIRSRPKHDTNVGSRRREGFHNLVKYGDTSTSRQMPRPAGLDSTTSLQPFNPRNDVSSHTSWTDSGGSHYATVSNDPPTLDKSSENEMQPHDSSQYQYGRSTGTLNPITQPKSLPSRRFAYVEDANSEEETASGNLYPPTMKSDHVTVDHGYMTSDQAPSDYEQSKVSHEVEPFISSSRAVSLLPTDRSLPSTDYLDDWDWSGSDSENATDQTYQRSNPSIFRRPLSWIDQTDENRKKFPRRTLRPRPPSLAIPRNPFAPNPTHPQRFIHHAPSSYYPPPPPSHVQPGPHVLGYAPNVPGLSYNRSPFVSYDPYDQYQGL
ncbi:hypothetical protein F5Y09DRAFT_257806 [Xylaria sp. FL1042]|nr:hypothetical protein F5Y09DRAFT_257806 [Xylaria sp. FL1042]